MTFRLQPFLIFKSESTRLNELYWVSKYAYSKTTAILKAIADSSIVQTDPRVDKIWGSINKGEATRIARPLSDFIKQLERNEDDLRFTSILHMCSAFETSLSNYYALCALYYPDRIDASKTTGIPSILSNRNTYESTRAWAIEKALEKLRGKYTKRLKTISTTFRIPSLASETMNVLDDYYNKRHLIAHDQSLIAADAPDWSAEEVIMGQVSISETTWKSMIQDFQTALEELDSAVQSHIVQDKCLAIGIYRIITRDGAMTVAQLKIKVQHEWKIRGLTNEKALQIAEMIGFKIENSQINGRWSYIVSNT